MSSDEEAKFRPTLIPVEQTGKIWWLDSSLEDRLIDWMSRHSNPDNFKRECLVEFDPSSPKLEKDENTQSLPVGSTYYGLPGWSEALFWIELERSIEKWHLKSF